MKNFKKILASIGMLGVAVPTALSVVACGGPNDSAQRYLVSEIAGLDAGVTSLISSSDGNLYATGFSYNFNYNEEEYSFWKIDLEKNKSEKLTTLAAAFNGTLIQATDGNLYGVMAGAGVNGHTLIKFDLNNNATEPETLYSFPENGIVQISTLVQASNGKLYATGLKITRNEENREFSAIIWEIDLKDGAVNVEEKNSIKIEEESFVYSNITNLIEISNEEMYAIFENGKIYHITLGQESELIYTPDKPVQVTQTIKTSNNEIIIYLGYQDKTSSVYKLNLNSDDKLENLFDIKFNSSVMGNLFAINNKLYTVVLAVDSEFTSAYYKIYEYDLSKNKLISENELTIGSNKEIVPIFILGKDNKLYAGSQSGKVYKISI